MNIPYYHIDAFTSKIFTGNPAGVCLLDSWPEDELLQNIAAENSLPETAFIVPGESRYALRWFTPTIEMDLCGHATLAAAYALELADRLNSWPVYFDTQSETLSVSKENDLYFLDFPSRPPNLCSAPSVLVKGLGSTPQEVYKSRDYLAVFGHEDDISRLSPDLGALAELNCLGIIVTAPGMEVDFVSRFFAPGAGVPEDPVTGSAHCTLIPYWSERTGKHQMIARQLSSRGGELICENKSERVRMGGRAVLYHSGTLQV